MTSGAGSTFCRRISRYPGGSGDIVRASAERFIAITHNEQLFPVTIGSCSQRCSLGMLIVRTKHPPQTLNALLQTLHEQPSDLEFHEIQTKCRADDGAIAGALRDEESLNLVLYIQRHSRNCGFLIWICANVQNGLLFRCPATPHPAPSNSC